MEIKDIAGYEFLKAEYGSAEVYFSTAKNGLNFNISSEDGMKNIEKLKSWFQLDKVGYLKQIHSSLVHVYDGEVREGDALITSEANTALGVFTADCIPILLYDYENKAIASVHSGWKGTELKIVNQTIDKMKIQYGTKAEKIIAFIGPHNRGCCYEFGKHEVDLYFNDPIYKGLNIYSSGKLDLEKCVTAQLKYAGVEEKNIFTTSICTHCNKEYQLYSYRRAGQTQGRLFSFIILRD